MNNFKHRRTQSAELNQFSQQVSKQLRIKLNNAFLTHRLSCPGSIIGIDSNYEMDAVEQIELMLNRFADYLITATALTMRQKAALKLSYQQFCNDYQAAVVKFASDDNDLLTIDDDNGIYPYHMPTAFSGMLDDEDDFNACREMSLESSPDCSPPRSPAKRNSGSCSSMPNFGSADEDFFQEALQKSASAPPISRPGSPSLSVSSASSVSGARRKIFSSDMEEDISSVAPSLAGSKLHPDLIEYAADLRFLYDVLLEVAQHASLNATLVGEKKAISIQDLPFSISQTSSKVTLQSYLQSLSQQLKRQVILPEQKVLNLVDMLCSLRTHLVINYYFEYQEQVTQAANLIGDHLKKLTRHFPQLRPHITTIEAEQGQRAQNSDNFTQWVYFYASKHMLERHNNEVVIPLKNHDDAVAFTRRHKELGYINDWKSCTVPAGQSDQDKCTIVSGRIQKAGYECGAEQVPLLNAQQRHSILLGYLQYIIDNKLPASMDQHAEIVAVYQNLQAECGVNSVRAEAAKILRKFGLGSEIVGMNQPAQYVSV